MAWAMTHSQDANIMTLGDECEATQEDMLMDVDLGVVCLPVLLQWWAMGDVASFQVLAICS